MEHPIGINENEIVDPEVMKHVISLNNNNK